MSKDFVGRVLCAGVSLALCAAALVAARGGLVGEALVLCAFAMVPALVLSLD